MRPLLLKKVIAILITSSCAMSALAQYVWLDEQGHKQYSDMPPPASVPNSKILKGKGMMPQPAPASADQPVADETPADKAKAAGKQPTTLAEKEADYQKRKLEQEKKDKETAAKEKAAAEKQKNCERARAYNKALESGQRINHINAAGERSYISDEERAREVQESRRMLEQCR
jgi:hypothetical protein